MQCVLLVTFIVLLVTSMLVRYFKCIPMTETNLSYFIVQEANTEGNR